MPAMPSWERKEEEKELKIKNSSIKNKITSIDSEAKWKQKKQCSSRRESRREITCRKCSLKTKLTSEGRRMRKRDKDSKTSRLKMNTPKCSTSKRMTEETKWNRERLELKNSWTKWQIASSTRWTRNNNGKMRWLLDMKKRKNPTKETWSKNVSTESRTTKKKCEIS